MRTYDFSPLFRYSVGFDHVEDLLRSAVNRGDQASTYPPYNIESLGETSYRITMALAGFAEEDLDIIQSCLLYTSPSPRDGLLSRMPSSA